MDYIIYDGINAPVAKWAPVGKLFVKVEDNVLAEVPCWPVKRRRSAV